MPTDDPRISGSSADDEANSVMDVVITPTYQEWLEIRERCYNPNHPEYKDFGAIGARVCEDWLSSYSNFLKDMGPVPHQLGTFFIERVDSSQAYHRTNCRWIRRPESNRRLRFKIHPTGRFDLLAPVTEPQAPITKRPPGGPFGHPSLQQDPFFTPRPKSPSPRCTIL